ncbi:MAG: 23S rRNA (adenine(2503)-C(2))-methyltransferase RlmN [Eubacteriales bacterium]|nr:23S rRNA (adenine(2503)-C(2))-methyltransferase RlmN [Eubacteriales bacterium]
MYLMDATTEELKALLTGWGEPAFRLRQVLEWRSRGVRPEGMTNLSKTLRERLQTIPFGGAVIEQVRISEIDGTKKYLFRLEDGNLVEGVLMGYHHGNTFCLSTQVGCRMGCAFCASTLEGLVRNLRAGEMLSILACVEQSEEAPAGERVITNIVMMGSGEPLDNYDNVLSFLRRVTAPAPEGMGISARNISLSTCGLVPNIYRLMEEAPPVTLCISLHAHNDAARSAIMPVNRSYPIGEVVSAAKAYAAKTGRRVIFEYTLIESVNASRQDANALAKLLRGINCHVNLIPLNAVKERELKGCSRAHAAEFCKWLEELHISATVRREMGSDIEGACGQLRRRVLAEQQGE